MKFNCLINDFLKDITILDRKFLIAIDFDGTLSEHIYPEPGIGKEIFLNISDYILKKYNCIIPNNLEYFNTEISTIEIAKYWKSLGNELILWTCREDKLFNTELSLTNAIKWCESKGLYFNYINSNHPNAHNARKILADRYIDDKSINVLNFNSWNMYSWESLSNPTYLEILSKK